MRRSAPVLAAVVLACWCQAAGAIVWDLGRSEGDTLVPEDTRHRFSGVGRLFPGCTATPIAPDLVVTAAHCLENGAGVVYPASDLYFFLSFEDEPDVGIRGERLAIHPEYPLCRTRACSSGGSSNCRGRGCFRADVALVWLRDDLPDYVKTYPLGRFETPPVGATVAHVGYGRAGTAAQGDVLSEGTLRYGFNRTTGVSRYEGALQTVFDASGFPLPCVGKGCFFDIDTWYRIREVATAPGDSGGPLFYNPTRELERNPPPPPYQIKAVPDVEYLIGVTSHGFGSTWGYGTINGYTFLGGPYRDWILAHRPDVDVGEHEIVLEPFPDTPVELVEAQTLPAPWDACQDGLDNDGDGLADTEDPGCLDPRDPSESSLDLPCDDGRDNDRDGRIDTADDGCFHPISLREDPACADGLDNDGDGGVDHDGGGTGRPDRECAAPWLGQETEARCGLGFEVALLLPLIGSLRRRRLGRS